MGAGAFGGVRCGHGWGFRTDRRWAGGCAQPTGGRRLHRRRHLTRESARGHSWEGVGQEFVRGADGEASAWRPPQGEGAVPGGNLPPPAKGSVQVG